MKKINQKMIPITYYAYNQEPFDHDATGFIPEGKLLDLWETDSKGNHKYIKFTSESDLPVPRKGFRFAYVAGEDEGVVKESDIYTRVYEEKGLDTGWGADYPGGGVSSVSAPDHEDAEGETYIRSFWG